ncbi:MAG: peptidoglycan DD-metalloendopeptidase family protein [Bacteroidaceae bacterium]|nr:peptidoglycan DD-metalloendopeptidase family protein [Bacteroidaceae bacterium]
MIQNPITHQIHHLRHLLTATLTAALAALSLPLNAQDKLANMAPVDVKLRAIDSVSIARLITQEEEWEFPAEELYGDWHNEFSTSYAVEPPANYRIDLRNFCMPTTSRKVTSTYGYRRSFRRQHYGTDIKVYTGDTIVAAFSGKVRVVKDQGYRKGYGKYVIIRHPNGLETLYGHLSRQLVKEDQMVKAGEPIGLGGNTGRSTGSHLHFETRFLGQPINPELLFSFEAQDVLGDCYVFRPNNRGYIQNAHELKNEEGVTDEKLTAQAAKASESRAFQQEKRAQQQARPRSSVHKVRSGESLSTIARKYGTTVNRLCRLNNLTEKSVLHPGQILKYN